MIYEKLKNMREKLLCEEQYDVYLQMILFMKNPSIMESTFKQKIDNFRGQEIILELKKIFSEERDYYREKIIYGQVIIWEEYLKAYKKLTQVCCQLKDYEIPYYSNNYLNSTIDIKKILSIYIEAKIAITKLENSLGVDRYLDLIAQSDFYILDKKIGEIKKNTEKILSRYKELYISNWNITNVYSVVKHKLISKNEENQICTMLNFSQNRVLLFIIDGFGMGQYLWSKKVVPNNESFTYNENIFDWLIKNKLSEEFILGAPLITDTAAGLSQIFLGKLSNKTRLFASNIKSKNSKKVVQSKKINNDEFRRYVDITNTSITLEAASELDESSIYYCSKYDENDPSGFSNMIFDSAKVKSIIPPERVFSILKNELDFSKKWLSVVYISSLDNSGHTMGSSSQFERYEHEKINTLLKNYLIQISKDSPDYFDGKTNILITADHGMTESDKINISRYDILNILKNNGIEGFCVEDNRAMFIYNINNNDIEKCKIILKKFFDNLFMDVFIMSKGDKLFDQFIPDDDPNFISTSPNIIISLISEGLFYSKTVDNNLMHFGGHGGQSIDEVFVPFISIDLNEKLLDAINNRFISLG